MAATTGLVATGFVAGLGAATAVFGAALAGAATLVAAVFAAGAFATVLAVFWDIELLLFLEDLEAEAFVAARVSLTDDLARLLDALRLAAATFFEFFEELALRDFCDTACARNCHAPV